MAEMMPSQKYLAGMKTYIFAGTAAVLLFVLLMWGPKPTQAEAVVIRIIGAFESIVLFVAGKAVASKAVDAFQKMKSGS